MKKWYLGKIRVLLGTPYATPGSRTRHKLLNSLPTARAVTFTFMLNKEVIRKETV